MYGTGSQILFKTSMLKSRLCDYSDAYILAKETITVARTVTIPNNRNKKVIYRKIFMLVCSVFIIHYSKKSGSLWQHYRDEPVINNNGNIIDFFMMLIVLRLNLNKK